jgi:hypothetical protein
MNTGWIKHDGGPCPIPWAKEGEFVYRDIGNGIMKTAGYPAAELHWPAIDEYKLTNGWVPILNGKCFEASGWAAKTWEYREPDGKVKVGLSDINNGGVWSIAVAVRRIAPVEVKADSRSTCYNYEWHNIIKGRCEGLNLKHGDYLECQFANGTTRTLAYRGGFMPEIVAVRRADPVNPLKDNPPKKARSMTQEQFAEWMRTGEMVKNATGQRFFPGCLPPKVYDWVPVVNGKCPEKFELWEHVQCQFANGDIMYMSYSGTFCDSIIGVRRRGPAEKVVLKGYTNAAQPKDLPPPPKGFKRVEYPDTNWEKIFVQNHDAYHRFRQSPRGKEALSMIGKHEGPAFAPLGEDVINEIAAAALEAHDLVWPRRKK